jgi:predicted RNase H-like HicB family nuclease
VAECVEIPVVTQGATLDEVTGNFQEAVQLHREGEDLSELGLAPDQPRIFLNDDVHLLN